MMSCIFVLYLVVASSIGAHCAAATAAPARRIPMRCTRSARTLASAQQAADDLGRAAAEESEGLRVRVEAGPRALLARRTCAEATSARRFSKRASRPAAHAIALAAEQARRTLLDRRQHGRARRVVRPAPGLKYRGDIKERAARPCCGSIPRSSKAPPTARSAAGTTRCRASSAAATRNRKSTCASRSPTTRTAPRHCTSSPKR